MLCMAGAVEEIWTEKYRPRKLDDIIGQRHIVERLKHFVSRKALDIGIGDRLAGRIARIGVSLRYQR